MCRGYLRCVAWFSYWFDNFGFISEGNTYRHCAASSLPLWGNSDVASSEIKRNFWRHCWGRSSTYLLAIYIICHLPLVFISAPFRKICCFIRPLFRSPFSCQISCLLCLLVLPCAFYLLACLLAKNLLILIPIHLLIFLKDPIMMNQLLVS